MPDPNPTFAPDLCTGKTGLDHGGYMRQRKCIRGRALMISLARREAAAAVQREPWHYECCPSLNYAGSLRNPAGWNNVFGFRTSYGRIPADGRDAWLPSMGVLGPMARNVRDLAMLFGSTSRV